MQAMPADRSYGNCTPVHLLTTEHSKALDETLGLLIPLLYASCGGSSVGTEYLQLSRMRWVTLASVTHLPVKIGLQAAALYGRSYSWGVQEKADRLRG